MSNEFFLPATFTDGTFLSSAALNTLGDAIYYVHGRATGANMPRSSIITDTELDDNNNIWRIRHMEQCDYVHYSMALNGASLSGQVKIVVQKSGGTLPTTYVVETNPAAGWTKTGYINISGHNFVDGEWYEIYVDTPGGSGYTFEVHYLDESDQTTLAMPGATGGSWDAPRTWSHADTVTSGPIDAFSNSLDYLRDILGQCVRNPAVLVDREHGPSNTDYEDSGLTFIHTLPWLVFRGSGAIVDVAGLEDPDSISDEDDLTAHDLSSVKWLNYGDIYRVEGCTFACEVSEIA
jgi:hypothetical protein